MQRGVFASCGVAITLLVNYLDGNVIKDSEGKAPYFDSLELFTVTSDNAEDFYKFLSDEALSTHTISDEEYQNLLVRNNAEVNYDYYVDFMANYARKRVCQGRGQREQSVNTADWPGGEKDQPGQPCMFKMEREI